MNETKSNGLVPIIAQAIDVMEAKAGHKISLNEINLAELGRLTGLSRSKLRTLKCRGFKKEASAELPVVVPRKGKLDDYKELINNCLKQGVTNSSVIFSRIQEEGYAGGLSILKEYIAKNKALVPAKRVIVAPQGNRGRRYTTEPGEAFQLDWGFTKVMDPYGKEYQAACFAIICHHCCSSYIEFFPNAKQENLFIGMIRAFDRLGVPEYILTDNMKSVVVKRDMDGHPIWNNEYETFMDTVGFKTKLCKPRHPFTKGRVERLVRFVKDNFLAGRVFRNITDLNAAALDWCDKKNDIYRKYLEGAPAKIHSAKCSCMVHSLELSDSLKFYLAPLRTISFDGFINYEGRRFGVPYTYTRKLARAIRNGNKLFVYSDDLKQLLATHNVTWSRKDSFCNGQYEDVEQPEEFPTAVIKTTIHQLPQENSVTFDKFNFNTVEDMWND